MLHKHHIMLIFHCVQEAIELTQELLIPLAYLLSLTLNIFLVDIGERPDLATSKGIPLLVCQHNRFKNDVTNN
jgi:hypothetical protein